MFVYTFSASICLHQEELVSNLISIILFNILICVIDNNVPRFYTISCHIINQVDQNIFFRFFYNIDAIWVKISDIDHAIKILVSTTFDISLTLLVEYIYEAHL